MDTVVFQIAQRKLGLRNLLSCLPLYSNMGHKEAASGLERSVRAQNNPEDREASSCTKPPIPSTARSSAAAPAAESAIIIINPGSIDAGRQRQRLF